MARWSLARRTSYWLIFVFGVFTLAVLRFGLHFNGLYGQDAHEYLRYSKAISEWWINHVPPGDFFWPVGYPFLGSIFSLFLPPDLSLQLVNVFAFIGIGILLMKQFSQSQRNTTAAFWFVMITCMLSPYFFRSAWVAMADMSCAFFTLLCFDQFQHYYQVKKSRYFLIGLTAASIAVHCRYVAFLLVMPLVAFTIHESRRNRHWFHLVWIILIPTLISLPHVLIRGVASTAFINHEWILQWSFMNYFHSAFDTIDGAMDYPFPNFLYALFPMIHPGYFLLFLPLLPGLIKSFSLSRFQQILLFSILIYIMFLAGIPFQNKRFFIPVFPFILLLFFSSWNHLYGSVRPIVKRAGIVLLLTSQSLLTYLAFQPTLKRNMLEQQAAAIVKDLDRLKIYTFDLDVALKTYLPSHQVVNLREGEITTFRKGELVLFNEEKLKDQWKNKAPMIQWELLKEHKKLAAIDTLIEGWTLYEIQ